MGQKSNTLTLRKHKKSLNLQTGETKQFLYGFQLLNFLEKLFLNKNVYVGEKSLNFAGNKIFLNLSLFFKAIKIKFYKRRGVSKKLSSNNKVFSIQNKKFSNLLDSQFKLLRSNVFVLNFKNLNTDISRLSLVFFYKKLKFFFTVLFTRRFNLFVDFMKITSLFSENKIACATYLYFLGQIFRILPKRRHSRFLFFLKYLFQLFISHSNRNTDTKNSKGNVKGIKFVVHGKLRGKTRASSACIQVGAVPIQSIAKNIEFARTHVYTLYGAFGFQMWVFRN